MTIIALATPFVSFADKIQSTSEAALYYIGYFISIAAFCGVTHLIDNSFTTAATIIAFWALYYYAENIVARELIAGDYNRQGIGSAIIAALLLVVHFYKEVFSYSAIKFKRPPETLNFQRTTLYILRSPYDEASLVLGVSAFVAKWAELVPRIALTAVFLSVAVVVGSLMWAMGVGVSRTLSSFRGDYVVLLIEFAIFVIMFALEAIAVQGLVEELGGYIGRNRFLQMRTISSYLGLWPSGVWPRWTNHVRSHFINVSLAAFVLVSFVGIQFWLGGGEGGKSELNSFAIAAIFLGVWSVAFLCYTSFLVLMMRVVVGRELFFRRLNASAVIGTARGSARGRHNYTCKKITATAALYL